jgi:hypothetical protein
MGNHRKGTVLIGVFDEENIDRTLRDLALKFGLTKSDLLRRFIRDGISGINQMSDWRRIAGCRDRDIDEGRKF